MPMVATVEEILYRIVEKKLASPPYIIVLNQTPRFSQNLELSAAITFEWFT